VLNCRDISERKLFEDQLAHQAFHDPVTGLANRALFADRVQHALARATREQSTVGVIFIDLDDFKTINDSLGHASGDAVLQEVSHRMRAAVRPTDTVARFGGDEFAVLVEEVERSQEAVDVAERVLEALNAPIDTGHKELFVGASVGLCLTNGDLIDRRRPAAQRRRGDVHGKARAQGQLSGVRAGHAPRGRRAARDARRPAARRRHRASSRGTTSR